MVDLVAVGLLGFAVYRGWHKGLVGQIFELGGGFLGLILGIAIGPNIASLFTESAGIEGALISIAIVFGLVTIGQAGGLILAHRFSKAAVLERVTTANHALGSGLGFLVTLISIWLVGSLLVQGPTPGISRAFQRSTVLKTVNNVFPDPPNVLAYLRQYLDTSGFPQVFAGFPRPIGPPVDLPTNKEARRAVRAAQESTVRIVAPACGGTQFGSGWVAGPDVVVTNAHVVSGSESVAVQDQAGDHPGTVVLFDPKTDVAVIRATGLEGPVLPLTVEGFDRGTSGATMGFPGSSNGELVWHRAAVQARFEALGRDIYGRDQVSREVYELRSRVRQGDSGGPFVLANGQVAGVVFAASTSDHQTGYALTGKEVEDEVNRGMKATTPVSTGGCTR